MDVTILSGKDELIKRVITHSRQAKQEFQACLKYSWPFCADYQPRIYE
jgi:hypothetical protein